MDWNTSLYDNSHGFVSKYGEGLLPLLNPQKGETILDLGCGTGDLANQIAQSGATVVGIDSSEEMIQTAKEKFPNIDFRQANVVDFELNQKFDAVFSNAVLHWVLEPDRAIKQIYSHLRNGGRFVAEFGGAGNIKTMTDTLRKTFIQNGFAENAEINFWYFPLVGEYTSKLERQKFRVIYAEHYDRPTELKGKDGIKDWFKMFGSRFFEGINELEQEKILDEVQNNLKDTLQKDGSWFADYKRLRIIATKN